MVYAFRRITVTIHSDYMQLNTIYTLRSVTNFFTFGNITYVIDTLKPYLYSTLTIIIVTRVIIILVSYRG